MIKSEYLVHSFDTYSIVKVTPHDGDPFHQNAHRALNIQVFPLKIRMRNDKSFL